ncbi:MAG TPA: hypothetical protein VK904_01840 [Miltoncostaeaceae bacterium]|nr:hypothetical protein [Miltoncostaeaceae bacterium]
MRQSDGGDGIRPEEEGAASVSRLGPPGWAEFSAARERFMQTVTVAGLETAWDAPARDPRAREWGEGPP